MTIKEIKILLETRGLDRQLEIELMNDRRSGARRMLEQYRRKKQRAEQLHEQWARMTRYETMLRQQGFVRIAGIDEVGRGPLAGPVVAAAVILPEDFFLPGLNDSKRIAPGMRERFYEAIMEQAVCCQISFADARLIDEINISQATQKAMRDCVAKIVPRPDICLVDGRRVDRLGAEQFPLVGGDQKSVSIAAASIVAKVTRDRWMKEAARQYPMYGFEQNAGYGTAEHLAALKKYGPCPLHRKTFGAVKEFCG